MMSSLPPSAQIVHSTSKHIELSFSQTLVLFRGEPPEPVVALDLSEVGTYVDALIAYGEFRVDVVLRAMFFLFGLSARANAPIRVHPDDWLAQPKGLGED